MRLISNRVQLSSLAVVSVLRTVKRSIALVGRSARRVERMAAASLFEAPRASEELDGRNQSNAGIWSAAMKRNFVSVSGLALGAACLLLMSAAPAAFACPAPTVKSAGGDTCSTPGVTCSGGAPTSLAALVGGVVQLPAIQGGQDATYLIVNDLPTGTTQFTVTLLGSAPGSGPNHTQYIQCLNNIATGPLGCQITGLPWTSGGSTINSVVAGVNFGPPTASWPSSSGFMAQITYTGIPSGMFEITFPYFQEDGFTGTLTGPTYGSSTSCSGSSTRTVTGHVYVPNGVDPLPNALVYIPQGVPGAIINNVDCLVNGNWASGPAVTFTYSAYDGSFTLTGVPTGSNIPIVVQSGKWRMQGTIPSVGACGTTTVAPAWATTMPQNHIEGDIPKIAVVTGSVDAAECVIYRSGVNASEFTSASGSGKINLYLADNQPGASITGHSSDEKESALTGSLSTMNSYDMIMFPCQGSPSDTDASSNQAAILDWANRGGRLFTTHYSYAWLYENLNASSVTSTINGVTQPTYGLDTSQGPATAVQWAVFQNPNPSDPSGGADNATVNTSFTDGNTMSSWLENTPAPSASTTAEGSPAQISISTLRVDQNGVNAPTQSWLTLNSSYTGTPQGSSHSETQAHATMQLTFNTPVGADADHQCGKVIYNDYHVYNGNFSPSQAFPAECPTGAMSDQEHLLEYALFELTNAVTPITGAAAAQTFVNTPTTFSQGDTLDSIAINVRNTDNIPLGTSLEVNGSLSTGVTAKFASWVSGGWDCTAAPGGITFTCTRSSDLANLTTDTINVPVLVAGNAPTGTGAATLISTISGGGLGSSVVGTDPLNIMGVGTINWPAETSIPYGTALSGTQLDATATCNGATLPGGTWNYTPAAGTVLHSGTNQTLSVTYTPPVGSACTFQPATNTITVTPRALTYTANSYTINYGQSIPALGYTLTSGAYVNGDSVSSLSALPVVSANSAITGAGSPTPAGTYTNDLVFNTPTPTDSDYTITWVPGTLTVNTIGGTINWPSPASIPYGTGLSGTQLDAVASCNGVPVVGGHYAYTPASGHVLNAGTNQTLSVTFTPPVGTSCTYSPTTTTLTVTPLPLTYTANNVTINYGAALPSPLTYSLTAGTYVNGDSISSLSALPVVVSTAGSTPTVGSHTGALVFQTPTPTDSNYSITWVPGNLTVNPIGGTITWPAETAITYGTPLSSTQLNAVAKCNGVAVVGGTYTYTPASGTYLNAGASQPLSVTFVPPAGTGCTWPSPSAGNTITVNKAPLTFTATSETINYGQSLPSPLPFALTSGSYQHGDTLSGLETTYGTPVVTSSAGSSPNPGSYPGALGFTTEPNYPNYNVTWVPGNLTVNATGGTINWTAPSAITYGTPLTVAQLNATATCGSSPVVGGTWTYTPPLGTVLPAGLHTLSVTFTPPSGVNCTYLPLSVPLTVNPAALTVTANNQTMFVNGTLPNAHGYTISGFVNGDNQSVVHGTATLGVAAGIDITTPGGPYAGGIVFPGENLTASNYIFNYVPGNLTVVSSNGTITWPTPAPITYGTPLTSTQLDAVATCNGNPLYGTYVYTPALNAELGAGTHTLSVTFTPKSTSTCSFSPATVSLLVNPAVLTVKANNVTLPLGSNSLPTFTDSIWGYVVGDNAGNVTITGSAPMTSTVPLPATPSGSQWPITFVAPTLATANYTFNYLPGVLTVGPPVDDAVTISFSNTNWNYPGEANVTICVASATSHAATGTVTLYDGNIPLVTLTLQGNGCYNGWYITPGLKAGLHVFTAYYGGDGSNPAGYSPQYPITVTLSPMTMEASCWNDTFAYGANYYCNANTDSGPKTGYMTYVYDGGAPVVLPLNAGGATAFTILKPPVGSHTVVISYPQQGKYAAPAPVVYHFTVTGATDIVSLAPSTWNPTTVTHVELSAGVASPSAGAPSWIGAITFSDLFNGSTTVLGTVPVNALGKCQYWASNLAAGTHVITATYVGANYTTNSVSITLKVVGAAAVATPTFSPAAGGVFTTAQTVSLLDATAGAKIYYTLDGSTPTTSSALYATPIQVTSSETIKAIAAAPGQANSAVATGAFTILLTAGAPVLIPPAGSYVGAQVVTLTSATAGATIFYTTNGHNPTINSTPLANGGTILVSASETVKAMAYELGYGASAVSTAVYTIH